MAKVVKREVVLRNYMDRERCYSMYFYTTTECRDCPKLKKCKEQKESEKSVNVVVGSSKSTVKVEGTPRFLETSTDSRGSFWNSYPISELTPEQRKHFKAIMRKEVRSK